LRGSSEVYAALVLVGIAVVSFAAYLAIYAQVGRPPAAASLSAQVLSIADTPQGAVARILVTNHGSSSASLTRVWVYTAPGTTQQPTVLQGIPATVAPGSSTEIVVLVNSVPVANVKMFRIDYQSGTLSGSVSAVVQ